MNAPAFYVSPESIKRAEYEFNGMKQVRDHVSGHGNTGNKDQAVNPAGRNKRTVWEIPTQPYSGAHFATYPEALVEPCILAGTSEKGVCADCGAPWRRVVETKREASLGRGKSILDKGNRAAR